MTIPKKTVLVAVTTETGVSVSFPGGQCAKDEILVLQIEEPKFYDDNGKKALIHCRTIKGPAHKVRTRSGYAFTELYPGCEFEIAGKYFRFENGSILPLEQVA